MKRVQTEDDIPFKLKLSKIKLQKKKNSKNTILTLQNQNHLSIPKIKLTRSTSKLTTSFRGRKPSKVFKSFRKTESGETPFMFSFVPGKTIQLVEKSKSFRVRKVKKLNNQIIQKIEKLASFAKVEKEKLKRNMLEQRSKITDENHFFPKEFQKQDSQSHLAEFINKKLSKLELKNDIIANDRQISFQNIHFENADQKMDFRDNFDLKKQFKQKVYTECDLREKLMITGERNRLLRDSFRRSNASNSILTEINRKKREKELSGFKRVFCSNLGLNFDRKKKQELFQFIKQKILKTVTKRAKTQAPKVSGRSAKLEVSTKRKPVSTPPKKTPNHLANLKSISKKTESNTTFNIKNLFRAYPGFTRFLEANPDLLSHFKQPLTRQITLKYNTKKLLQNAVYNRQEFADFIRECRSNFKREENLQNRIHLAIVLGTNLAYKLKAIYKEQGDFICMVISQVAKDFESFRQLVGRTVYQTVKSHKEELIKIEKRRDDQKKYFEGQLKMIEESHKKNERRSVIIEEECSLMKKLIYELQTKNERYLRIIEELKENKKRRNYGTDSQKVRDKFKNIIRRLIPENKFPGKRSFLNISKRIIKRNVNRRVRNSLKKSAEKSQLIESRKSFINSHTVFQSKDVDQDKNLTRMYMRMYTQMGSRSQQIYSSGSENSVVSEEKKTNLLSIPQNESRKELPPQKSGLIEKLMKSSSFKTREIKEKGLAKTQHAESQKKLKKQECNKSVSDVTTGTCEQEALVPRIGQYLLADIEEVSRFYLLPDRCVNHRAVQMTPKMADKCVQTNITLMLPVYDEVFSNMGVMRAFIQDFVLRRNFSAKDISQRIADIKRIQRENRMSENINHSKSTFLKSSLKRFPTKKNYGLYTKINTNEVSTKKMILCKRVSIRLDLNSTKNKREFAQTHDLSKSAFNHSIVSQKQIKPNPSPILRNMSHLSREQMQSKNSFQQDLLTCRASSKGADKDPSNIKSIVISNSNSNLSHDSEKSVSKNSKKNLEQICREVFDSFIKKEVVNNQMNLRSKEKFLKHITAFLLSEEIKNKSLLSKNNKFTLIFRILKRIIRVPASFRHLRKNRSFSKTRNHSPLSDDSDSDQTQDQFAESPSQSKLNQALKSQRRSSCPQIWRFGLRGFRRPTRVVSKFNRIFHRPRLVHIWRALKGYISASIIRRRKEIGQGRRLTARRLTIAAREAVQFRLLRKLLLFGGQERKNLKRNARAAQCHPG